VQQNDYTLPLPRMKSEKYDRILVSAQELLSGEKDLIANLANVAALIKTEFDFWWVGFYLVKGNELVLGPFQGPVACTRIAKGKGVCGTSWNLSASIVVPDVHKFEGHIACSAASNSEIVVPLIHENKVWGVLDIDSVNFESFNEEDRIYLEKLVSLIAPI
jgi:L-methionine (R)-S-oxide reductase